MVQLSLLSGKQAGTQWVARRFPVRIGRAPDNDLRLEEDGVWDRHLEIQLDPAAGCVLAVLPDAAATVNREPVQRARLRNGDSIEFGSARLRFWLAATRPRSASVHEAFVWLLIGAVLVGELALICGWLK